MPSQYIWEVTYTLRKPMGFCYYIQLYSMNFENIYNQLKDSLSFLAKLTRFMAGKEFSNLPLGARKIESRLFSDDFLESSFNL